ncbi:MAG: hypothetical protein QME82_05635 [Bacillota bacterium]|nr:hypothetical protein [Bacillota bacterium]MDI6638371.1 hypothetical protein [Bacillota bacterium]
MKCRQTLKAMVEILQQSFPGSGGNEVCSVISRLLGGARVYFVDSGGHVAGDSIGTDGPDMEADEWRFGNTLTPRTVASLWAAVAGGPDAASVTVNGEMYAVAPVTVLQETLGLLVARLTREPSRDDLDLDMLGPLAAAAGAVLALKYQREEDERERNRRAARSAIQSLSYSEIIAVRAILDTLDGDQGLLVASRIADNAGMTRSVVVNALRKLSSANLVRTRSLGMKGTFVRLLNPELRTELESTGLGREALPGPRTAAAEAGAPAPGNGEEAAAIGTGPVPNHRVVHA